MADRAPGIVVLATLLVLIGLGSTLLPAHARAEEREDDARILIVHSRGHKWNPDRAYRDQVGIRDHYRYYDAALAAGTVYMAGPFVNDAGVLTIVQGLTADGARAWALEDPLVASGVLSVKVLGWTTPITADDPIQPGADPPDIRPTMWYAPGPRWDPELGFRAQPGVARHLAFLGDLRQRDRVVLAGPVRDDPAVVALAIFASGYDAAQLEPLVHDDPAVTSGTLTVTAREWLVVWKAPTGAP